MKNFLTLLLLVCCTVLAQAQIPISVSGYVLDESGDPVENVTLHISTDSMPAFPFIYTNTVYTDANGFYSDNFDVPVSATQGTLFVVMENCPDLGYVTAIGYWSPPNTDLNFDFTYCDYSNIPCNVVIESEPVGGTTAVELTALADGYPNFTYLWSDGSTGSTLLASTSGTYCVTITASNNCTAEACATVIVGSGSNDCGVDIAGNPSGALTAVAFGEAPFTYSWNTGQATPSIFPNAIGQYCVTITDATGCMADTCVLYQGGGGQDTLCSVFIEVDAAGGANPTLLAVAEGVAPFSYQWSTNETTQVITVSNSGTYCVTVTDAEGCAVDACTSVQLADNDQIAGFIYLGDSLVAGAYFGNVYLIVHDVVAGTLTAIDTVDFMSTPNGLAWYSFGVVPAGDYLVKAALDPASSGYETNLPTYYFNSLFWDEATTISIPSTPSSFDILLVEGQNLGGPGFIGGLISEGANFSSGNGDRGEGDPLSNVSILLFDEFENPLTHTESDPAGQFEFANLPWGTYKLVVEIFGKEQGEKWVTIGPDQPAINVEFVVNENEVTTSVSQIDSAYPVQVMPNPVQDELRILLHLTASEALQVRLLSVDGKVLYQQASPYPAGTVRLSVPVQQLPEGLYLLQIQGPNGQTTKKVVKQ